MAGGWAYAEVRLDTVPSMTAAIGLYREEGFEVVEGFGEPEAYYEAPNAETVLFGLAASGRCLDVTLLCGGASKQLLSLTIAGSYGPRRSIR